MINLTSDANQNIITLKAIFEGNSIPEIVEKSNEKTTLVDSKKVLYVYFKESKISFCQLTKWFKNFASSNERELNIDISSFANSELNENEVLKAVSEALLFANHTVVSYKQEKAPKKAIYHLISNSKESKAILEIAKIKLASVNLTRDLQDTPPNLMYPEIFAQDIEKAFAEVDNVKITVLDKKAIQAEKMGLLLSVASASHHEPRVVVIEYKGNKDSNENIALVGKGITFDTGGISLKPSNSMLEMKFDMSGAAIVCSTILALAKLKSKVNVVAVATLTENKIGGHATLVEAVVTSKNGKTVEIQNTDAEGRLVLGDGITYAIRNKNATKIIDVATLTGAIVITLGHHMTGAFSNNDEFYQEFEKASKESNEPIWRLPILKENVNEMKHSAVADLSNIGKDRNMGSSQAAAFLQEFVEDKPFIHLDIAGTANTQSRGTGVMVKTLIDLLNK